MTRSQNETYPILSVYPLPAPSPANILLVRNMRHHCDGSSIYDKAKAFDKSLSPTSVRVTPPRPPSPRE